VNLAYVKAEEAGQGKGKDTSVLSNSHHKQLKYKTRAYCSDTQMRTKTVSAVILLDVSLSDVVADLKRAIPIWVQQQFACCFLYKQITQAESLGSSSSIVASRMHKHLQFYRLKTHTALLLDGYQTLNTQHNTNIKIPIPTYQFLYSLLKKLKSVSHWNTARFCWHFLMG